MTAQVTAAAIRARKGPDQAPIVMITVYDFPTARIVHEGAIDIACPKALSFRKQVWSFDGK